MAFSEFPKWLYNAAGGSQLVRNASEERALGKGWEESAEVFKRKSEPPAPVPPSKPQA